MTARSGTIVQRKGEEIASLYLAGNSMEGVARQVGVSVNTVQRALKDQKVAARQATIDDRHGDEIVTRYEKGESISQISTALKISGGSVQRLLKLREVPVRTRGGARVHQFDEAEALRLYEAGASLESVAEQMRCSYSSVRRVVIAAGKLRGRRQKVLLPEGEVDKYVAMYEAGSSVAAIAEQYGHPHHVVRTALMDRGVKRKRTPNAVCTRCCKVPVHSYGKCKPCQKEYLRERAYLTKYGITIAQYNELLEKQGCACGICGRKDSGVGARPLQVDHCHETGQIRGLLCFHCNKGIGYFGDTVEGVRRVLSYLEGTNG